MTTTPLDSGDAPPDLASLGWGSFFEAQRDALDEPLLPARVVLASSGLHHVLTAAGPRLAAVVGRLAHTAEDRAALPTVGDWVGLRPGAAPGPLALVHTFSRRTCLRRKAAGRATEAQVIAANVDAVFVVTALNADFNPRRLERYVEAVLDSGARPVLVLNKADLCPDPRPFLDAARAVAPAAPVALASALSGDGLEGLRAHVSPGETVALVGSSGVGKSALTNRLLGGQVQREGAARASDDRGRHTTAHRQLFVLAGGGLLVDTPGMRELSLWADDDRPPAGFADVDALAAQCRFRDCAHEGEPGCALARALEKGALAPERLAAFHKLAAEQRHAHRQKDARARLDEKRRWKQISKRMRDNPKR